MSRQEFSKKKPSTIRKVLGKLPDAPGVYFFLGRKRKILYIGRATSLRSRVRSYFDGRLLETRGPWLVRMLSQIRSIDFKKTDSILEAVFLETDLIKRFQPPYNTNEKDDKSFNCVVITKEAFPQLLVIRKKDLDLRSLNANRYTLTASYGPFPAGFHLQTAMKLIRRIFPYRDGKCSPLLSKSPLTRGALPSSAGGVSHPPPRGLGTSLIREDTRGRPCFNRQIGLCPGVCTGEIGKKEYAGTIRNLRLFFEGKKPRLLKLLKREMKVAARREEFERAGELKRQLFALKHIQDIALLKRDALIPSLQKEMSESARTEESPLIKGGAARLRAGGVENPSARGLATSYRSCTPFASEDGRSRSCEAPSIRFSPFTKGRIRERGYRIEAYDLSHFGGKEIVGAMAVVENGVARPSEYRLFKLQSMTRPHETAGLQEILRRRFNHPEWPLPQLVVVDGNEVQRKAAEAVLSGFGQKISVVAVVKDEHHRPREVRLKQECLSRTSTEVILLANAEAHRFVLKFQRKRRSRGISPTV